MLSSIPFRNTTLLMDTWALSVLAPVSNVSMSVSVQTFLWTYTFISLHNYLGVDLLGHGHYFYQTYLEFCIKTTKGHPLPKKDLWINTWGKDFKRNSTVCVKISAFHGMYRRNGENIHKTLKRTGRFQRNTEEPL